jgi:phosphatidylglycerophosphatase A
MFSLNKLSECIATFFYIGKIKYCPGTFGSLAAFPLCYLISYYSFFFSTQLPIGPVTIPRQLIMVFAANILCSVLLFIIGTFFSSIYARYKMQDDPKEAVIDEVVGQMLTVALSFPSVLFVITSEIPRFMSTGLVFFIFLFLLPFILFRFCDIIKPWPINWLDKNIKGGIGIMLDDILAAIFAAILHYAITFTLISWFG